MALIGRRWVLLTCLGFALVAVALLPPSSNTRGWLARVVFGGPMGAAEPLDSWAMRVRSHAAEAADNYALLSWRDTALRVLPAHRVEPGAPPMVLDFSGTNPANLDSVRQRLAGLWNDLGAVDTEVVTAFLFVPAIFDSRLGVGIPYAPATILPPATGGRYCIGVIRGDASAPLWRVRRAMSPCAVYAVFGRPGPAIERWLLLRAFDVADSIEGGSGAPITRPPPDDGGPAGYRMFLNFLGPQAGLYGGMVSSIACAAGRHGSCAEALNKVSPRAPRRRVASIVVRSPYQSGTVFNGAEATWLWDLASDAGHDRFRRFWKSSLPVDSAFAGAFGQSLDEWTAAWVRRRLPDVQRGSGLPFPTVLTWLLVASGFVGLGALVSRFRTVGA